MRILTIMVAAVLPLLGAGCTKQAGGPPKMPPPQVVVAEARAQRVVESLSRVADIQANEMIEIKAEAEGIVREILFEEGQRVEKGQVLVRLDQTKFEANLAQIEANFQLAKANFERSKQLYEDKLVSQQEFDQSASAYRSAEANLDFTKRQLQDAVIFAPFSGIMGARQISPGQLISKNTIVSWLIDSDPVKVEFHVPERFVGQVKVKQSIEVTVEAYPGKRFGGEVFFVSPFVDPINRTALIKARIPNPNYDLKPGMFANLDLTLVVRENATVIPEAAITQVLTNEQAMVFAVVNGAAQMRKIKTGVRLVGAIEVREGLQPGEKVVVEGLQKVVPGAPVRVAEPGGGPSQAAPATTAPKT